MKRSALLLIALSLVGGLAVADVQTPASLPGMLNCDSVYDVYGKKDVYPRETFAKLTALTDKSAHWANGDYTEDGVVTQSQDDDKVVLDFGVGATGGDQYSTFTFRKDDLKACAKGKLASLPGLYEDGYDWADGYHTRSLLVLRCTK